MKLLVVALAGWINRQQEGVIEYWNRISEWPRKKGAG